MTSGTSLLRDIYPKTNCRKRFKPHDKWKECNKLFDDIALSTTRCGDCWATSAASSTAQRLCIRTKEAIQLSSSFFLNCTIFEKSRNACDGARFSDMFETFNLGFLSGSLSVGDYQSCVPYQFKYCKEDGEPGCPPNKDKYFVNTNCTPTACTNTAAELTYYAKGSRLQAIKSRTSVVKMMKQALFTNGPIIINMYIGLKLDKWLKNNKGGIFEGNEHAPKGTNHIAVVQGWQKFKGTEYWTIMGDWGRHRGVNGYINIPTSKNVNLVESDAAEVFIPGPHMVRKGKDSARLSTGKNKVASPF